MVLQDSDYVIQAIQAWNDMLTSCDGDTSREVCSRADLVFNIEKDPEIVG